MKKLITILLLVFTLTFSVNAQFQLEEDYSFKRDKQYHAIAGTLISATAFMITYNRTGDAAFAKRSGIIFAVFAGGAKEMADGIMGKEMMISDLLYTSVFAIGTSLVMEGVVKHRKKKELRLHRRLFPDDTWSLDNVFINKVIP